MWWLDAGIVVYMQCIVHRVQSTEYRVQSTEYRVHRTQSTEYTVCTIHRVQDTQYIECRVHSTQSTEHLNKKCLLTLEIFLRGAYIRNFSVIWNVLKTKLVSFTLSKFIITIAIETFSFQFYRLLVMTKAYVNCPINWFSLLALTLEYSLPQALEEWNWRVWSRCTGWCSESKPELDNTRVSNYSDKGGFY